MIDIDELIQYHREGPLLNLKEKNTPGINGVR